MLNLVRLVRQKEFEGETPTFRHALVATIMNLYELMVSGKELTLNNIMDLNGLSRQSNLDNLEALVKRDVLEKKVMRNAQGRGRVNIYYITESAAKYALSSGDIIREYVFQWRPDAEREES